MVTAQKHVLEIRCQNCLGVFSCPPEATHGYCSLLLHIHYLGVVLLVPVLWGVLIPAHVHHLHIYSSLWTLIRPADRGRCLSSNRKHKVFVVKIMIYILVSLAAQSRPVSVLVKIL